MKASLNWGFRREGILILVTLLFVSVATAFVPGFLDPQSLSDRSRHWVEIGLVALPMTFVIATGGIDLSVGSLVALSMMTAGRLQSEGCPLGLVIASALLTGLAGGLLNAALILFLHLPPVVATLATLALFRGLAFGLSGAQPVSGWPDEFVDWGSSGAWSLGMGWEVPWLVVLLLAAAVVGTALFHRHALGRRARQIGENRLASLYAGIGVHRVLFAIYGLTGLACGLAAVCWTARFATAHPAAETGMELDVIVVVVAGGTRITGGAGSVAGTVLGVLLFGLIRYGLDALSVSQQDQSILVGVLLIAVATVNERWSNQTAA